jgi:hypothetical protein
LKFGFITGLGLVLAILAPLAVAAAAVSTGGAIFSAGPLNAVPADQPIGGAYSHADLACSDCHAPFWGTEFMGDRCLDCHTEIGQEMTDQASLHGTLADAANCRTCHTEHHGEQAELTRYDRDLYPHAEFGFYLISHRKTAAGTRFQCSDCHTESLQTFSVGRCGICHLQIDHDFTEAHLVAFDTGCLNCHDGVDSYGSDFDHQQTEFPLVGGHMEIECAACHYGAKDLPDLQQTPQDCAGCHLEDDAHSGRLGDGCAACHSPDSWQVEDFDHTLTGFPLVASHGTLQCADCHEQHDWSDVSATCIDCHAGDDVHQGRLGTDCVACHNASDWSQVLTEDFDHSLTRYPLTGKHASIVVCESCHAGGQLAGTPTQCIACHRQDDAHRGGFGLDCAACHITSGWQEAAFDHGLTGFRLAGAHAGVPCASCHPGGNTSGASGACISCHASDDAHNGRYGENCAACHSPTRWSEASFDHAATGFKLTGVHGSTACTSCHVNGTYKGTPRDCAGCHSKDDAHGGSFGTQCAACHSTTSWSGANFDHGQTGFPLNGLHLNVPCTACHSNGVYQGTPTACIACHRGQDVHSGANGTNCAACHTTGGWESSSFDHGQTAFPLTGLHKNLACTSCHVGGVYAGTPKDCASCHASDDAHAGSFGTNCASCHTTSGWANASFDHSQTAFPLTGLHQSIPCNACHANGVYSGTPKACVACHASDDAHGGSFGTNCGACHTTSGWANASFDHSQTAFPLSGAHGGLACSSCHQNGQYAGTPSSCASCHGEPAYHAGLFGTDCKSCHTTNAWLPASYNRSHGFPLNHGNAGGDCSACHGSPLPNYTCTKCHAHDPARMADKHAEKGITDISDCLGCHPGGGKD